MMFPHVELWASNFKCLVRLPTSVSVGVGRITRFAGRTDQHTRATGTSRTSCSRCPSVR